MPIGTRKVENGLKNKGFVEEKWFSQISSLYCFGRNGNIYLDPLFPPSKGVKM